MQLRPYQLECCDAIDEAFKQHRSALVTMPTGAGKTIVFSETLRRRAHLGRAIVLAHREELITQAADKIKRAAGLAVEIEMGESWADMNQFWKAPVIVSTVQTQARRKKRFDPNDFATIIVDEAHHATARSWANTITHYSGGENTRVLGVTATPDRSDESSLGAIFDTVAYTYDIGDAIHDGWLVPIRQRYVTVEELNLESVHTVAGDFRADELASVMEASKPLHKIADSSVQIIGNRKTLVFASSVNHAEMLKHIYNSKCPGCAEVVLGSTDTTERRDIFKRFYDRKFNILVNVGVATEGFDDPGIEVIVMGRPTKSRSLYSQMLGRGTRVPPGIIDTPALQTAEPEQRRAAIDSSDKPSLLVLDFVGNAGRHKLFSAVDILGGKLPEEISERVKRETQKQRSEFDVDEAIREAELAIAKEREKKAVLVQAGFVSTAKYSWQDIDPFNVFHVLPWREPPWHRGRRPSDPMVRTLKSFGVELPEKLSFQKAKQMIDLLMKRRRQGLCTYKQAKTLRKFGVDAEKLTFNEASRRLEVLLNRRRVAK